MKDPKVIDLMSRIRLIPDPEIIHTRAVVTITTRGGKTLKEDIDILPVHLDAAWRAKVIPQKFLGLVSRILGEKKAKSLLTKCQGIERMKDISTILPLTS